MSTATIEQFLKEIADILRTRNGDKLREYLIIEPPLPHLYAVVVTELRTAFPAGSQARLEKKCEAVLPEYEEGAGGSAGGSWPAFVAFLVQYFAFIRDVNAEQLVETHDLIKSLLNQCVLALSDATMGIVVLPTVIALSRTLSRLSIGLEKHPALLASMTRRHSTADSNATERTTLVESSANVIREAFSKCLSERSGSVSSTPPSGRRIGIYTCANLCLKLFFHCRKLRSAEQIFGNIYAQSPPLSAFPAAQRVSYLYYLGRYLLANNHFPRAASALQAAYNQCHRDALPQRRKILVPLCAANVCIGRFPSSRLLARSEMEGAPREAFTALCGAIRRGDLVSFRKLLDLDGETGSWFLSRRVLLQLRNRCEVLVWRSLARRVFLLAGSQGGTVSASATSRAAPTLKLEDLAAVINGLERRAAEQAGVNGRGSGNGTGQQEPVAPMDPDLEGASSDSDVDANADADESLAVVESGIASLVQQGLLHGYVSHKHRKFVITGAKNSSALIAGFPPAWSVLKERVGGDLDTDVEVPGWVRDGVGGSGRGGVGAAGAGKGARGGMVVNMSGLRTVGAGA